MLAVRPKTLGAAFAPVAAGAGLADHHGFFAARPALGALVLATLLQIAANLANDYYDFVKGADTRDRVGPVRVTQAGLLPPGSVRSGMLLCLAASAAVGVWLTTLGGWPMAAVLAASLACAVAYTGGPYPLGYHGLGDIFAGFFFGPVAVVGTVYLQNPARGWPAADAFLAGAGAGALATAVLASNNLRDLRTDRAAGKRTLAVIFGRRAAKAEYATCVAAAFSVPLLGWACFGWPAASLAAMASAALVVRPLRTILAGREPAELAPALAATARCLAVYGGLLAAGLALG